MANEGTNNITWSQLPGMNLVGRMLLIQESGGNFRGKITGVGYGFDTKVFEICVETLDRFRMGVWEKGEANPKPFSFSVEGPGKSVHLNSDGSITIETNHYGQWVLVAQSTSE